MDQQNYLEYEILVNFRPIFKRTADKAKGEIFPTIWYGSNLEVTSIQQSIMAKSVLVAENPFLKYVSLSRHTSFPSLYATGINVCSLGHRRHRGRAGEGPRTMFVCCYWSSAVSLSVIPPRLQRC